MRQASRTRDTRETSIQVGLDLDGSGRSSAATGLPFLDHMLAQLGKHAGFDLAVKAQGDLEVDAHHTVEDVGIVLGECLRDALGDKAGVRRFASISLPLDEALVDVALDLSGRPFCVYEVMVPVAKVGTFDTELVEHFCQSLAFHALLTLHVDLIRGRNGHHIIEAVFKSLALALHMASRVVREDVPSTKGTL